MKVSVIIPSLNPDEKLICVVDSLREAGFDDIILVNDGSDENHREPFEHASAYPECTILTHEVNKGKGRGLKTAFEYCIKNADKKHPRCIFNDLTIHPSVCTLSTRWQQLST